jgi:hypothetical protein
MKKKAVKKTVLIILASIAGVLAVCLGVLLLVSGANARPKYLSPWDKDYAAKFDDPRIQLAAHGLLAANGHNAQPWIIRLDPEDGKAFWLYADYSRLMPQVDPLARQTMVSQGTFLENVRVAGTKLGYRTSITLFPEGPYAEDRLMESMKEKPVARIELATSAPAETSLYDQMFLPDTNRGPYRDDPLTEEALKQASAINDIPEMKLVFYQDRANLDKLGGYAVQGAEIESRVHRINEESAAIFRPNEREKNKYRYGFSVEGQGTSGFMKHILQAAVTLFPSLNGEKSSAERFVASTKEAVEHTPGYAMIISADNSRASQVKSGMLYGRLVLALHSMGFAAQPPSQVLEEYEEMKGPYKSIHEEYAPEGGTIQMFVRYGKPTESYPLTMRQDILQLVK